MDKCSGSVLKNETYAKWYYNFNSFIYTTGYTVLKKDVLFQLHNDFYRFAIGLIGSIAVCCVVHSFVDITPQIINKVFAYVGSCTLGIYILSNYIFDDFMKYLPIAGLNYWLVILESVVTLVVTVGITTLIRRFKISNKLLLGGRWVLDNMNNFCIRIN